MNKCNTCCKLNHNELKCKQQCPAATTTAQPPQTGSTNAISNAQFDGYVLQMSSTDELKSVPRVNVKVTLADKVATSDDGPRAVTVNALADTGASHCIISERVWKDMKCCSKHLSPSSLTLGVANSTSIDVLGVVTINPFVPLVHYTVHTLKLSFSQLV